MLASCTALRWGVFITLYIQNWLIELFEYFLTKQERVVCGEIEDVIEA